MKDIDTDHINADELVAEMESSEDVMIPRDILESIMVPLARNSEVTDGWDDIRVTNRDGPAAWADVERDTIYINIGTEDLATDTLVDILPGLMAHEKGHIDSRLAVPGNNDRAERLHGVVEERIKPHIPADADPEPLAQHLLNISMDMEIHHQIIEENYHPPSIQRQVRSFVNRVRNSVMADGNTDNIMLCREVQETSEQEEAKEIVEDRSLTVEDKAVELARIIDWDDPKDNSEGFPAPDEPAEDGDKEQDEENRDGPTQQSQGDGESDDQDSDGGQESDSDDDGMGSSGSNSKSDSDSSKQEPEDSDPDSSSGSDTDNSEESDTAPPDHGTQSPGSSGSSSPVGTARVQPVTSTGKPTDERDRGDVDTTSIEKDGDLGVSISSEVEKARRRSRVQNKLEQLGMDSDKAKSFIQEHSIEEIDEYLSNLDNVLEDVLPALRSAREDGTSDTTRPGGDKFDGFRKPRDMMEMADSPVDLLTVGQLDRNYVKVERRSRTKSSSGVVFVLRDTSGSMIRGDNAKFARDATVSLIKTAQKHGHDIGVIDFSGDATAHKASDGSVVSQDYHELMVKCMELKSGGGTVLSSAIEMVNDVIENRDYQDIPVNLYVVTDSHIMYEDFDISASQPKLNCVWTHEHGGYLAESMKRMVEKYNGDVFRLHEKTDSDLLAELYESY